MCLERRVALEARKYLIVAPAPSAGADQQRNRIGTMDADQLRPGIERQNMILAWLNGRYHQREARAGEVPLAQIDRRTWAGRTAEISVERSEEHMSELQSLM